MQATWDWVQNGATARTKWSDIGDWDVSGVEDFARVFSNRRDITGAFAAGGNPKAAVLAAPYFIGTSKWITTSATSLQYMFDGVAEMNSDLRGWNTAKVTDLRGTFSGAAKFVLGSSLDSWDTASVTTLEYTFWGAGEMNAALGGWNVAKVTTLASTFYGASKFVGTGLSSWDTASVTTLESTFRDAGMNADLSKWQVSKVVTLADTFNSAPKYTGTGLVSWITTAVTSLDKTFDWAGSMNADLR